MCTLLEPPNFPLFSYVNFWFAYVLSRFIVLFCLSERIFLPPSPSLYFLFTIPPVTFILLFFYFFYFKDLLNRVEEFQTCSQKLLATDMPRSSDLQQLLDSSFQFDLELPLESLRERLEQARWLEEQQQACQDPGTLTLDVMRRLIDLGVGLAPHPTVEKAMAELQELLTMSEHMDDRCKSLLKARLGVSYINLSVVQFLECWERIVNVPFCNVYIFSSRPRQNLSSVTAVLREAESVPVYLPSVESLRDAVERAREWLQKVETLQVSFTSQNKLK